MHFFKWPSLISTNFVLHVTERLKTDTARTVNFSFGKKNQIGPNLENEEWIYVSFCVFGLKLGQKLFPMRWYFPIYSILLFSTLYKSIH